MAINRAGFLLAWALVAAGRAAAQEPTPAAARTAVFLDCQTHCDFDFIRREVTFVDWARDRTDADVHLLLTSEETGGGERYTFSFIGQRRFTATADTLHLTTRNTDVNDEIRAAQVRVIKLGLVRFVTRTPVADRLTISFAAPDSAAPVAQQRDPWNYWTFDVSLDGEFDGEQRSRQRSINVGLGANRVTERMKFQLSGDARRNHEEVEIDDTTTFVNDSRDYSADGLLVFSLGPHWSAGVLAEYQTSTFENMDLMFAGGPGVEYNVFPYSQSSRKRFTFRYAIGGQHLDYEEITIFDKTRETRPVHDLRISANLTQPWGSINSSVEASQYLDDFAKHNVSLFVGTNVRIVRGLSMYLYSNLERIKDQIFLPRGEATPEEIVAERRQLGTDYRFSLEFGLNFRFGSKFNNVVNPRFGG